ncbi:MAG: KpsF/GutQ family sugar-phosphate isomerase [Simkaniaceae bacterium]|nr:KpsF/GutQ family sugar-phosphate isomerase [Simkaniaceae bacterium]
MLAELFQKQRSYLSDFFDEIDHKRAEVILKAFLSCKGMIIFTGVGKSGIIAEKLAMTMISTGTRALYLPAQNALHGDIGVVTSDDIVVCISKSGDTLELVDLLPFIKKRQAISIAWVSEKGSRLEQLCDQSIYLPVHHELCPFDLAPTTSTVVQLIFGDILAVAMMERKGFTIDQYALNHPRGSIGKQIAMRVSDVMLKESQVPICHPDDLLREAIVELTDKRCGCLLVCEEGKMVGIFTDGDLRRTIQNSSPEVFDEKMKNLMNREFLWIDKNALASKALAMMQLNPHKRVLVLPVLSGKSVEGLLCMHDLVHSGVRSELVK